MNEIYYNSDITSRSENELKLLTLYYDKINVVTDTIYSPIIHASEDGLKFAGSEALRFVPPTFEKDYKLLLDEKILTLTERNENEEDEYEKLFSRQISQLVNSHERTIFPDHPGGDGGKIVTEEVYNIMKSMLGYEWGMPVEVNYVWWYYSLKLKWFLKLLVEGKTCLSSSNNLNILFSDFINNSNQVNQNLGIKGYTKSLAADALKISLPNPSSLSFEDILELKLRLKDELELFYQTINSIEVRNKVLMSAGSSENDYQALFFSEVQAPLQELEIKIKNIKSKTFRDFISKMQNPQSYTPLIGTVVASLPLEFTTAASLGINVVQSFLEYKEERREIQNNGLYFLLKVK